MAQEDAKPRLDYIDNAKGIGIILVVLGHTVVPEMRNNSSVALGLYHLIYSFHMPFFIMLSGVLFFHYKDNYVKGGFKQFEKNKLISMMLPYVSFSLITYVGLGIAFGIPLFHRILTKAGYAIFTFSEALHAILTCENHIDKHLWFCYVLFIIFTIYYLLIRVTDKWQFTALLFIIYFVAQYIGRDGLRFWIVAYRVLTYLIYFDLSRYIPKIISSVKKLKIALGCSLLVFVSLFYISNSLITSHTFDVLFDFMIAIFGSLSCILLSACLNKLWISKAFRYLGKHSYDIYLIHQPFVVSGVAGILLMVSDLPYVAICAITFITGIFVPLGLSNYIIRKSRVLKLVFLGIKSPKASSLAQ